MQKKKRKTNKRRTSCEVFECWFWIWISALWTTSTALVNTFSLGNPGNLFYYSYTITTQSFHKVGSVRHYEVHLLKSNPPSMTPLEQLKPISDAKGREHLLFPFESLHQRSCSTECSPAKVKHRVDTKEEYIAFLALPWFPVNQVHSV